jgi:hypothetical protein
MTEIEKQIIERLDRIERTLAEQRPEPIKEWYTTAELAAALGKKPYTVQEKWCNAGRIECEKDRNGKWRIPGHEYRRLKNGGGLMPARAPA